MGREGRTKSVEGGREEGCWGRDTSRVEREQMPEGRASSWKVVKDGVGTMPVVASGGGREQRRAV